MCGLTGFARHPDAPELERAIEAVKRMLPAMEHRGKHATGIAATGDTSNPFVWKWAAPASVVVNSDPFLATLQAIAPDTTVLLGHVRHATHDNAHVDAAAHPFAVRGVVGAHNGIIYNWRDVEKKLVDAKRLPADHVPWAVDSEAAFGALATHKDPIKALDMLDGYWALTWTKKHHLYLCRTANAPLTCAYSGSARTLFWHSERAILAKTLYDLGYADAEFWEVATNTLYRYHPARFTEDGTSVQKLAAPFRGRIERDRKFDSARPATVGWDTTPRSTTRTVRAGTGVAASTQSFRSSFAKETDATTNGKAVSLLALDATVKKLASKLQGLEKEVEIMYRVLDAHGLLDELDAAMEDTLPSAKDTRQLALPLCIVCGKGDGYGTMLPTDEGPIHEGCVLRETRDGAYVK